MQCHHPDRQKKKKIKKKFLQKRVVCGLCGLCVLVWIMHPLKKKWTRQGKEEEKGEKWEKTR